MIRILIGLAIGGLLALLEIYPAYARMVPVLQLAKVFKPLTEGYADSVAPIPHRDNKTEKIKPLEEALTLSRFSKGGQVHVLAVLADDGEQVTGVDLSEELRKYSPNSFDVISGLKYDEMVKHIRSAEKKLSIAYAGLLPAVDGDKHLAIGINYAEHGKETGQVRPFMFPKLVRTDAAVHQLDYVKGWLLDHEVELGIVFPSPVYKTSDIGNMLMGFLVVNDFTDRATLMREMDSQNVTGGKGFPDAKSKRGFLPTGPYLVIPRHWRPFVKELHLSLSVNGQLRQNGFAKGMVWDIDKIIERSLSVKGKPESYYHGKMVKLFEGNGIPANSIILTGTPAGVVFNAPTKGFIFSTVAKYIFTGGFFSNKMHPYILQQYLKKELHNPRYLKPGDRVETAISFLGRIHTNITENIPEIAK